ncbi:MAG: hypothetical protein KDB63_02095 [Nocardioidaceae bacterium]|nr:hypothetical protein [Nocardioidaceae bacterium]
MRSAPLRVVVVVLVVGGLFTAGGTVGGWLWERHWAPVTGVAYQHQFVLVGQAPARAFSATSSYLVLALLLGLVLGVSVALVVRGREWATLVTVVGASAWAAWLMAAVGHRLGPADPAVAAAAADDFTRIPQDLTVSGVSPFLALPFGAILGLAGGFVLLTIFPRLRSEQPIDLARLSPDTTH